MATRIFIHEISVQKKDINLEWLISHCGYKLFSHGFYTSVLRKRFRLHIFVFITWDTTGNLHTM